MVLGGRVKIFAEGYKVFGGLVWDFFGVFAARNLKTKRGSRKRVKDKWATVVT